MSNCTQDCWKCHWCWLGRCMNGSYYGQDVSVSENQPENCERYISKEDWNKQYVEPMKQERCMELLKSIIDNISTGEDDMTVIKYLLYVGFTNEELTKHFGYNEDTVVKASQEMDDYEDNLIFT